MREREREVEREIDLDIHAGGEDARMKGLGAAAAEQVPMQAAAVAEMENGKDV